MHAGHRGGRDTSRRKWYKAWLLTSHAKKIRSLVSEMLRKRVTQDRIAKISNRTTWRILHEFKGRRHSILTRGGLGEGLWRPWKNSGANYKISWASPSSFVKENDHRLSTGCCEYLSEHAYLSATRWKIPCYLNLNSTIMCCSETKVPNSDGQRFKQWKYYVTKLKACMQRIMQRIILSKVDIFTYQVYHTIVQVFF